MVYSPNGLSDRFFPFAQHARKPFQFSSWLVPINHD
jgi:hypothetical protein